MLIIWSCGDKIWSEVLKPCISMHPHPRSYLGAYCFCPVCLCVFLFGDTFSIYNGSKVIANVRDLIFGKNVYLIKPHIIKRNITRSRSSFKVKCQNIGQIAHFNIGHNIWSNRDRHWIFGVHVYLTRLHILSGNSIWSRSFFKVKGQI